MQLGYIGKEGMGDTRVLFFFLEVLCIIPGHHSFILLQIQFQDNYLNTTLTGL